MGVGGLGSRSVLGSNRAEGAEKNVCTKAQNLSGQLDPDYSLAVARRYKLDQICIRLLPGLSRQKSSARCMLNCPNDA